MEIEELASRITHDGDRIGEAELGAFEKSLAQPLPADFRCFLLLAGGGGELDEPLVYDWRSSTPLGPVDAEYGVALFCRPVGDEYHSIRPLHRHIEDMEHLCTGVPREIYVIADDWGGDFLTIDLRSDSYGQIGLVDHETVGDHFEDAETYEVIAPSFSAFVAGLREPMEEGLEENRHLREAFVPQRTGWADVGDPPYRSRSEGNEGLWVMIVGGIVALIALAWLNGFF